MNGLLKSRKFWLMVVDVVISIASYMVTHYVAPENQELALYLIVTLQPVVVAVIGGIALEDAATKNATSNNEQKE